MDERRRQERELQDMAAEDTLARSRESLDKAAVDRWRLLEAMAYAPFQPYYAADDDWPVLRNSMGLEAIRAAHLTPHVAAVAAPRRDVLGRAFLATELAAREIGKPVPSRAGTALSAAVGAEAMAELASPVTKAPRRADGDGRSSAATLPHYEAAPITASERAALGMTRLPWQSTSGSSLAEVGVGHPASRRHGAAPQAVAVSLIVSTGAASPLSKASSAALAAAVAAATTDAPQLRPMAIETHHPVISGSSLMSSSNSYGGGGGVGVGLSPSILGGWDGPQPIPNEARRPTSSPKSGPLGDPVGAWQAHVAPSDSTILAAVRARSHERRSSSPPATRATTTMPLSPLSPPPLRQRSPGRSRPRSSEERIRSREQLPGLSLVPLTTPAAEPVALPRSPHQPVMVLHGVPRRPGAMVPARPAAVPDEPLEDLPAADESVAELSRPPTAAEAGDAVRTRYERREQTRPMSAVSLVAAPSSRGQSARSRRSGGTADHRGSPVADDGPVELELLPMAMTMTMEPPAPMPVQSTPIPRVYLSRMVASTPAAVKPIAEEAPAVVPSDPVRDAALALVQDLGSSRAALLPIKGSIMSSSSSASSALLWPSVGTGPLGRAASSGVRGWTSSRSQLPAPMVAEARPRAIAAGLGLRGQRVG